MSVIIIGFMQKQSNDFRHDTLIGVMLPGHLSIKSTFKYITKSTQVLPVVSKGHGSFSLKRK